MTWTSGVVLYVLIWWMVFFAVLPLGIRRAADGDSKGHDRGAPANPRLWFRVGLTTAIATALFAVAFWLVESQYLSLR